MKMASLDSNEPRRSDDCSNKKCSICLETKSAEFTHKLSVCNHSFCKECLIGYLNNCDEALEVRCPFSDQNGSSCSNRLQDSERDFLAQNRTLLKQYELKRNTQRELLNNSAKSEENEELKKLVESGAIMRCPKCNILLEKIDSGCQFIRCFMCKLDICYVTRQPRWGPMGKGDTSAGCKCGVDGKKCHPDCVNCH